MAEGHHVIVQTTGIGDGNGVVVVGGESTHRQLLFVAPPLENRRWVKSAELSNMLDRPLWLGMLVGNFLSSFTMSYFTMPYYGNPTLKWWLKPSAGARQPSTNIRGLLLVLAINAAWALVFYLITMKVWSLP